MITDTFVLSILLAANLLLLLVAITALQRIDARCRRLEEFKLHAASAVPVDTVAADDSGYASALEKLEKRLEIMQRSIMLVAVKTPEKNLPEVRSLPIENAVRMAKEGATIDDLTRTCGLNIGEARLMKTLHGNAKSAALRN